MNLEGCCPQFSPKKTVVGNLAPISPGVGRINSNPPPSFTINGGHGDRQKFCKFRFIRMTESQDLLPSSLQTFSRVIAFGLWTSGQSTGKATTEAGEFASFIQAKMCVNAASAEHLCHAKLFDHSGILALCRMVVDAMTLYYYLNESVGPIEWGCRKLILRLHDTVSRIKLVRAHQEKGEYEDLVNGRNELEKQLKENAKFVSLDKKHQQSLLSGEMIYIDGMRKVAVRTGWDEDVFGSIYNYFSTHTHSLPMSFTRIRQLNVDFVKPSTYQKDVAAFGINVAEFCLLRTSMHYASLEVGLLAAYDTKEIAEFKKELEESTVLTGTRKS